MYAQFFSLFALIAVGYAGKKMHLWTESFHSGVNALIMKIAFPAMIIQKIASLEMEGDILRNFFLVLLVSVVMAIIIIALSKLYLRMRHFDTDEPKELRITEATEASMTIPNCGFIGFPVALLFYGSFGLLYTVSVSICMFFMLFGYAEILFMTDSKGFLAHLKPVVKQPALYGAAVGLIMAGCGLHLPPFFDSLFGTLGSLASPISMIYIGSILAGSNMLLHERELPSVIVTAIAKLIILPIIALGVAMIFFKTGLWDALICSAFVVAWSLPTAALVAAFADNHGGNARLAGWHILVTTVLSMGMIPLWVEITARVFA